VRVVAGDKIDPRLHQAGDKENVARQPVELGDHQDRAAQPAGGQRGGDLRPAIALAALDLLVTAARLCIRNVNVKRLDLISYRVSAIERAGLISVSVRARSCGLAWYWKSNRPEFSQ
jgi:hypothetical protein